MNTKNLAFLAFPEMAELLISELAGRFGITRKPNARYGDLLYFENLELPAMPYWHAQLCLTLYTSNLILLAKQLANSKKSSETGLRISTPAFDVQI